MCVPVCMRAYIEKERMTCGYFLLNRYQRYLSSLMHTLYVCVACIHCFVSQAIRIVCLAYGVTWAKTKMKNVNRFDFGIFRELDQCRIACMQSWNIFDHILYPVSSIRWPKYVLKVCFSFLNVFGFFPPLFAIVLILFVIIFQNVYLFYWFSCIFMLTTHFKTVARSMCVGWEREFIFFTDFLLSFHF